MRDQPIPTSAPYSSGVRHAALRAALLCFLCAILCATHSQEMEGGPVALGTEAESPMKPFYNWFIIEPMSEEQTASMRVLGKHDEYHLIATEDGASRFVPTPQHDIQTLPPEKRLKTFHSLRGRKGFLVGRSTEKEVVSIRFGLGYVFYLEGAGPGLFWVADGPDSQPVALLNDTCVSAIVASGGDLIVSAGCRGVTADRDEGSIVVVELADGNAQVKRRLDIPYFVRAASLRKDGSFVVVTTNCLLELSPLGDLRFVYGFAGFHIEDIQRVSWRGLSINSVVRIGNGYAIGSEFGAVWICYVPEVGHFTEAWLFPPSSSGQHVQGAGRVIPGLY